MPGSFKCNKKSINGNSIYLLKFITLFFFLIDEPRIYENLDLKKLLSRFFSCMKHFTNLKKKQ